LGFAILAAACSVAGAMLMADTFGPYITAALIGASVLLVLYETSALPWIRARRERGDRRAARAGVLLLILACLYSAAMQFTFFGAVMFRPMAADQSAAQEVVNIEKRITDLETRRSWYGHVGQVDALKRAVAQLEADVKAGHGRDAPAIVRKQAQEALKQLPQKRADLEHAESRDKIDAQMVDAREKLAVARGRPPADAKAAVFAWIFGQGPGFAYLMAFFGVVVIQAAQILLPTISGRSEIVAAYAKAAVIDVGPKHPEARVEIKEAPPAPAAIAAPVSQPLRIRPLQIPPPGPMALAAMRAQAELAEPAPEPVPAKPLHSKPKKPAPTKDKPTPATPAKTGLAARIR